MKTKIKKAPKKRISVASAKAKGRNLQQWICRKVSDLTGLPWGKDERIASREMGQSGTDIRLIGKAKKLCPISFEAKRQEAWNIHAWIKQAQENQLPGTDWVVIAKRSRTPPVAILDADFFFQLLNQAKGLKNKPVKSTRMKRRSNVDNNPRKSRTPERLQPKRKVST